jgi:hypothetical protein
MKARSWASSIFRLACLAFMIWQAYRIWTGQISWVLGLGFIIVAFLILRTNLSVSKKLSPVDAGFSLDLHVPPASAGSVTPQFIEDLLARESVVHAIRVDLMKTRQIGYREVWRLCLITPDQDRFDPRPDLLPRREGLRKVLQDPGYRATRLEQVPLKRTAVLHSTSYFNVQLNSLVISGGTTGPLVPGYPVRSYRLGTKLNKGEFMLLRDIQTNPGSSSALDRSRFLPDFLREEGFPLKESYRDGDPLTTERGGTIVLDRESIIIIYPAYFVQRSLIDDEGNLLYVGLDESFDHGTPFGVSMRPSVSERLIRCVDSNGYTPVLRYRSFPYASDLMLPLLDTPMSCSGWADLFVDTRGKARLFIARDNTMAEWHEMMERLRQLFFRELARKDYHLLGLTKDHAHLSQYLSQKESILADYYLIRDWQLF